MAPITKFESETDFYFADACTFKAKKQSKARMK